MARVTKPEAPPLSRPTFSRSRAVFISHTALEKPLAQLLEQEIERDFSAPNLCFVSSDSVSISEAEIAARIAGETLTPGNQSGSSHPLR